jgi:hypothetical protein
MLTKSTGEHPKKIWHHNANASRHAIANAGAELGRPRLIIRSGCKTIVFVTTLDLTPTQG